MAWRSMDTAPKDGTPILLIARAKHAASPCRVIGWWLDDEGWVELSSTSPVGVVPEAWEPLADFPRGEVKRREYTKHHLDVPGLEEPPEDMRQRFWDDAKEMAAQKSGPSSEQWWYDFQVRDWKEKSYTRLNGLTYTFTRDDF